MTPNEIQILIVGIAIGAQATSITHSLMSARATRKAAARTLAAAKRSAGDRYLSSLHLYNLRSRYGLTP